MEEHNFKNEVRKEVFQGAREISRVDFSSFFNDSMIELLKTHAFTLVLSAKQG